MKDDVLGAAVRNDVGVDGAAGPLLHNPPLQHSGTPLAIPDHELVKRIGGGSYGEVWLARNVIGAYHAVKVIRRSAFDHDRPFEREFEGIQKAMPISHAIPGLVHILQVGRNEQAGYFYYAMELADSVSSSGFRISSATPAAPAQPQLETLNSEPQTYSPRTLAADLKQRGPLPVEECVELGVVLTDALSQLHQRGLVHRDIKPSNIIFVRGEPKLADIGLMAGIGAAQSFVGTAGFIPPEGPGTPRADLYSLGKVLYEMATGKDRQDFPELPVELFRESPHPETNAKPETRNSKLPPRPLSPAAIALVELNSILVKACETDFRKRYQTAQQMHDDLTLLQRGQSVKRERAVERRWAASGRAIVAVVVVTVLAANFVLLWRSLKHSGSSVALPAVLSSFDEDRPSTNAEANQLCAKGLYITRGDFQAQFAEAYTNFHRAIALDPSFARAYVGLFELRLRESVPSLGPTSFEEIRTITQKLEELAPHLAATYSAQSVVQYYDWNFQEAERYAALAVEADPKYELGHNWRGFVLTHLGRPVEGRAEREISRALAPSKTTVYRGLGHTYYMERDYPKAIAQYREAIKLETNYASAYYWVGRAFQARGDYAEAIQHFRMSDLLAGENKARTEQRYDRLLRAFNEGGERAYWQEAWKLTDQMSDTDFYWKAAIQVRLGHLEQAFKWLNKSYETRERFGDFQTSLTNLLFDEYWDSVRGDRRFTELLDKVGFTKMRRVPQQSDPLTEGKNVGGYQPTTMRGTTNKEAW
jgi:serine/threonine protein kinase/Tfp pilus assembly protein PilF